MTLTLSLGQKVQGDELIEIVEASMRDIGDWKVEKKEGKIHEPIYVGYSRGLFPSVNLLAASSKNTEKLDRSQCILDSYVDADTDSKEVLLCLQRYDGIGIKEKLIFTGMIAVIGGVFIVSSALSFLGYLIASAGSGGQEFLPFGSSGITEKDTGKKRSSRFAENDSIFTFLDPHQSYAEIKFYINAAYDVDNPQNGCRVESRDSSQFQKIKPTYSRLVQNILRNLPAPSTYRG